MKAAGRTVSIQDGELQALAHGQALTSNATFLSRDTGLEGSPEVDEHGVMSCRARILPGLAPGFPVQTQSVTSYGSGIWRIDKVRYVGDTWGKDWNAELTKCIAITSR